MRIPEQVMMADDDRNPIELLADQFVAKYRRGEHPTIEQFAQEHPDFGDDIRNLFPIILRIEHLKHSMSESGGGRASIGPAPIDFLGDFRIIREIGRGGMGIVYEAEQQSLRRRVALKVLGKNVAGSEKQVRRFKREAEAAARLHHTNIVPVFGVGQENDLHYYAMQLIDGVGLDAVFEVLARYSTNGTMKESPALHSPDSASNSLSMAVAAAKFLQDGTLIPPPQSPDRERVEQRPSPVKAIKPASSETVTQAASPQGQRYGNHYWRSISQLGIEIANALDYAHHHGILHRDVKPSNLLLDREGIAWIADFGLAKHAEGGRSKNSGDIIGTLRYMAPEQFSGWADTRTDIYSLGLTLYELLTLQPAFGEATHGTLIQQKKYGAPAHPRTINPRIPRDLATIIVKACATDPAHRYQSGDSLAADLQRFLDERPIAARRVGTAERLWKWCRRNPWTAASSFFACVLLMAMVVVAGIGAFNTTSVFFASRHAQEEIENAKARAEVNLTLAIESFDSIVDGLARRRAPLSLELGIRDADAPRFTTTLTQSDTELAQNLLAFYELFSKQNLPVLQSRVKVAEAYRRIGEIHRYLGHTKDAQSAFVKALELNTDLLRDQPERVDLIVQKVRLLNELGELFEPNSRLAREVLGYYQQATEFLEGQSADVLTLPDVRHVQARTHLLAATALIRNTPGTGPSRPSPAAEVELQRAQEILALLASEDPENLEYRLLLAKTERMRILHNKGADIVVSAYQAACALHEKLVQESPADPNYTMEFADTLAIASTHAPFASTKQAEEDLHRSIKLCVPLAATYPGISEYEALLVTAYRELAATEKAQTRLLEADQHLELAKQHLDMLMEEYPLQAYYSARYILTMIEWAEIKRLRAAAESNSKQLVAGREILDLAISRLTREGNVIKEPFRSRVSTRLYRDLSETLKLLGEERASEQARTNPTVSD